VELLANGLVGAPNRILVTGATGAVGGYALTALADSGHEIFGLARDPGKARFPSPVRVRQGDYEDLSSLRAALRGIDTLVFISSDGDRETMLRHHRNVVASAKDAGIRRILYTGILDMAEDSPFYYHPIHRETERLIAAEDWQSCILRTSVFTEFLHSLIVDDARNGEISLPGEGKISLVTRKDVGFALARLALSDELFRGIHFATGPVAAGVEDVVPSELNFRPCDIPAYRERLRTEGRSGWYVEALSSMYETIAMGNFSFVDAERFDPNEA